MHEVMYGDQEFSEGGSEAPSVDRVHCQRLQNPRPQRRVFLSQTGCRLLAAPFGHASHPDRCPVSVPDQIGSEAEIVKSKADDQNRTFSHLTYLTYLKK
jgi:hypothetical protein